MSYAQKYKCNCGGRTNCPGIPCERCKNRADGRGADPRKVEERLLADIQDVEPFDSLTGPMIPGDPCRDLGAGVDDEGNSVTELMMPVYLPSVRFTIHYKRTPHGIVITKRTLDETANRAVIVDVLNEWDLTAPALIQSLKDVIGGGK